MNEHFEKYCALLTEELFSEVQQWEKRGLNLYQQTVVRLFNDEDTFSQACRRLAGELIIDPELLYFLNVPVSTELTNQLEPEIDKLTINNSNFLKWHETIKDNEETKRRVLERATQYFVRKNPLGLLNIDAIERALVTQTPSKYLDKFTETIETAYIMEFLENSTSTPQHQTV